MGYESTTWNAEATAQVQKLFDELIREFAQWAFEGQGAQMAAWNPNGHREVPGSNNLPSSQCWIIGKWTFAMGNGWKCRMFRGFLLCFFCPPKITAWVEWPSWHGRRGRCQPGQRWGGGHVVGSNLRRREIASENLSTKKLAWVKLGIFVKMIFKMMTMKKA